ncbi:MAG TPA: hypothetical protein VL092_13295 [Chitinophagaceae bacterium]|nr:hypothetical protein [Chitinophagaceae bacterium]
MSQTIRAMFLALAICLLCLPATGFACGKTPSGKQHNCCAKGQAQEHWCEKGQTKKQQTGKECDGACSGCCAHHLTEFTMQPVFTSLQQAPHPNQPAQRWAYSEEYSFTDFQLIWTPPKSSLS